MFSARSFIAAAGSILLACASLVLQSSQASAQSIDISLNVFYSTPSDMNSGGVWQLVAKSSNFGIAALQARVTGVSTAFDASPFATVNGNKFAGFFAGDSVFFNPASGSTPGYYELDFGQAPFDSLGPGQEQGIFYGVGQLANGSPNFPGKPVGSNSEGPAFTTLAQPFGIPWATGDPLNNATWNTAAVFGSGEFSAGQTPAFVTGNGGTVFTALGTSTTFGTVATATMTAVVRTNFSAGILGDYNHNGVVDAADYALWRNALNQSVTPGSGADGSGNGTVDAADYDVWRKNFGNHTGAGSGSGSLSTNAVPEPFSAVFMAVGVVVWYCGSRPRRLCPVAIAMQSSSQRIK